jgi:DnaJ-domain-containing protein 1
VPLLVLAVIAAAILIVVGRREGGFRIDRRMGPALVALAAAAGAVATALRGQWIASVVLIAVSAYFGTDWRRGARRSARPSDQGEPMRLDEAREILGVGVAADRLEIESAYRRLMLRAHPDRGGSTGLAAKLNTARDRLLKKN